MTPLLLLFLYSLCSGVPVFLGGSVSRVFEARMPRGELRTEIMHTLVATGGGIIVAAVAFVLVPKGIENVRAFAAPVIFAAGALVFFGVDRFLQLRGGAYGQLLAMLMDFVPEAIALGAVFATNHRLGLLLAIFIGLQNFPEAFNSYGDLRTSGLTPGKALLILAGLVWTGPVAALGGRLLLQDRFAFTAGLMLFAAGGLLYLVFQDIAPLSKAKRHWFPAVGASIGFVIGMVGHQILG